MENAQKKEVENPLNDIERQLKDLQGNPHAEPFRDTLIAARMGVDYLLDRPQLPTAPKHIESLRASLDGVLNRIQKPHPHLTSVA